MLVVAAACGDRSPRQIAKPKAVAALCTAFAADTAHPLDEGAWHDPDLPCRIAIWPTGVALAGNLEGSVPDPHPPGTRLSDGRYLTKTDSDEGIFAFWGADGTFLKRFGSKGDGPGEISFGVHGGQYIADRTDTIHVRDIRRRWSVFDPQGNFVRLVNRARFALGPYRSVEFLDDGRVLAGQPILVPSSNQRFHISSRMNEPLKSFGEAPPGVDMTSSDFVTLTAYEGGASFWAASPGRYRLEKWDTSGVLLDVIDPEPEWFTDTGEGRPEARMKGPVPDRISVLAIHHGVLWVRLAVAKEGVETTMREAQMAVLEGRPRSSPWAARIEAYDASTGALLASAFYPDGGNTPWGQIMDDGTGSMWRSEVQPSGLTKVFVDRFGLAAR